MKWVKYMLVALVTWGSSSAMAKPNPDFQTIKSWMVQLNSNYQGLNVMPRAGFEDAQGRAQIWRDLVTLQDVLEQQVQVEDGGLISIACANAVCGDDSSGACHTCAPL